MAWVIDTDYSPFAATPLKSEPSRKERPPTQKELDELGLKVCNYGLFNSGQNRAGSLLSEARIRQIQSADMAAHNALGIPRFVSLQQRGYNSEEFGTNGLIVPESPIEAVTEWFSLHWDSHPKYSAFVGRIIKDIYREAEAAGATPASV